jgi:hypothetical protein
MAPGPVLPLPAEGRRQLIVKRALGAVAADGVHELFVRVDMSAISIRAAPCPQDHLDLHRGFDESRETVQPRLAA